MSTGRSHTADKLGRFTPKSVPRCELAAGEVGFVIAGIKEIDGAPVGDTITLEHRPASEALPGFEQIKPRVFAGLFPVNSEDYEAFRDALSKLKLERLGAALRAGSLRRPRVWLSLRFPRACCTWISCRSGWSASISCELITSAPTVVYEVARTNGTLMYVDNPAKLPPVNEIEEIREPIILANILVPPDYVGAVLEAVQRQARRAEENAVPGHPGIAAVRTAAGRSGARLLRPAEVGEPRLCLLRL